MKLQLSANNNVKRLQYVVSAVVMYVLVEFLIELSRHHILHRVNPRPPSQSIIGDALYLGIALAIALVLSSAQRLPLYWLGFSDARMPLHLGIGILSGVLCMSTTIGLMTITRHLTFSGITLNWTQGLRYGVMWGIGFMFIGMFEEFFYRGFLMSLLSRGVGFWIAALFMSFMFAFGHHRNPGESPIGLTMTFVFAMVACFVVRYTNSLWWSIGFHAAWNWSQAFLYGTASSGSRIIGQLTTSHPVGPSWLSGGSVGPEGSVFGLLTTLCAPVLIVLITRRWQPYQRVPIVHPVYDSTTL